MAKTKIDKVQREKTRIVTSEFRVAFPHLYKPNAMQDSKPKYSITMLFSKKQDLALIKKAIRQAKINEFGDDESDWPEELESCVRNGDLPKYAKFDGFKGHWAIKATSNVNSRPSVVDEDMEEIAELSGKFYPGCYARASIFGYVWTFGTKQGVGFIVDHVQKLREGKPFGGKPPVDQVFSPVNTGKASKEEDSDEDDF